MLELTPWLRKRIHNSLYDGSCFTLTSKELYHNGKLGVTTDYEVLCEIITKMSGRSDLIFWKKDEYNMCVKVPRIQPLPKRTAFTEPVQKINYVNKDKSFVYYLKTDISRKIGITGNMKARLAQIQTGNPLKIEVLCTYESTHLKAKELEYLLHEYFKDFRESGEWFRINESAEDFLNLCSELDKTKPS